MRPSRLSRRTLLGLLAAALPFGRARSATAQTTLNGCEVGFVNGLLQIDPTCNIGGPGGPAITAPAHLAPPGFATATLDDTPAFSDTREERLRRRRDKKRDKRFGRRDRRGDHKARRRDRKRERRQRRARKVTCSRFASQEEAQVWHEDHTEHSRLVESSTGLVCLDLDCRYAMEYCEAAKGLVSCSDFDWQEHAQAWHEDFSLDSQLPEFDGGWVCLHELDCHDPDGKDYCRNAAP